jgi:hypothetical protein
MREWLAQAQAAPAIDHMELILNKLNLAASIGLELFIFIVLLRKGLRRRFPWFSIYIIYSVLENVSRLASAGNPQLYQKVYWLTTIGDSTFSALAVRESFLNAFRAYARIRWFIWTVWTCIGLAVLYAIYKAWLFPPIPASRRGTIVVGLEFGLDCTIAAIGLLYFGLRRLVDIKGREWESGIVSGFFIYAACDLPPLVARSAFGTRFRIAREWTPAVGYLIAAIGWAAVLSRPETPIRPKPDLAIDDLTKLDQHRGALDRLLGRDS